MNFDELKKQWDDQSSEQVQINPDLDQYKEVDNVLAKLRKNVKYEFITWIVAMLFLLVVPLIDLYKIEGYARFAYYLIFFQMLLSSMVYYRRFFYFYKSASQSEVLSSRENLLKMYYDLKFAIDSYKTTSYVMIPQALIMYMIMLSNGKFESWFNKLYHIGSTFAQDSNFIVWFVLSAIVSIALVIFIIEIMSYSYYGKHLKEIRKILDQLED
ncbi:hypothetical protein HMPREF0765_2376 [Sphingobacterium spiritivorum ATCC 33300]|uniref:Uncharacterized protein n=1 Tax=Sphingobacterium spiritivorum ATCC 33300 TaxID=525372 RepID=C2FYH0_SPHSI|nr:hypothetical protein [Sphingobacterium spiritivorum]EEI92052.1 hypothetical protein HMPREF0765_2376 [Sphingobacterium spiritivorum ATCC 33300]QQS96534.1 hypothetical protein I6J03_02150 [Sphingobacterium spiritivorum]